jgi:hypothetical protein
MQAIARHFGAELKVDEGSIVAEIVPERADYQSWVSDMIDEPLAFLHAAFDLQKRLMEQPQS